MKTRKIAQAMTALTLTAAMFTGCSGTNSSITVISREDGSGTRDAFTELMGILVDDNVSRPFNIATKEDISELAADFVDYILSADGQAIIEEEGYISVSDRCGGLSIFPKRHLVLANGAEVVLTLKEFAILFLMIQQMIQHRGRVYTRDELLSEVWGYQFDGESRTVDVHIRTLRVKLGDSGKYLETVRGVGYRFSGKEQSISEPR